MSKIHYPNIEKALKIKISRDKISREFRADPTALPGTPIVGRGKTKAEAKYNLCMNWVYMFVSYYSLPEYKRFGGDHGYVPIIQELLKEDLDKTGLVS
jgi:hypothetical protein